MVTLQSDGTVWQSRPTSLPTQGVNQVSPCFYVSSYYYTCLHNSMYVFSYYYHVCVLILVLKQAAERKRLDWGAHAASTANVPKPQGQVVVEGDVGGSLTDQAAVNKCAIVGEGNVVLWRGDGECEILMPNACVAQSLGKGCGWLWTNAGGLRQIRGAPKAKGPVRAPPVKVERRVQAETGDVLVSRADLVLTLHRRDGTELVMHRDASEMVSSRAHTPY